MTHVSRNYADQIAKDRSKIVDEIIRRDGPAPPTTTLTTRLRELMEEATPSWPIVTNGLAYQTLHAELQRNLPTIIRLLEAGDSAEKALAPFAATCDAMDREVKGARNQQTMLAFGDEGDREHYLPWPIPDDTMIVDGWRAHDPHAVSEQLGFEMRHLRDAQAALATLRAAREGAR